jgi:hypothetical protein
MNMKQSSRRVVRLCLVATCTLAAVLLLVSWSVRTYAQNNSQGHTPVHMTTDWSNRHMVYSAPSSMAQAWRLQAESRYLNQWTRRNAAALQAQGAR